MRKYVARLGFVALVPFVFLCGASSVQSAEANRGSATTPVASSPAAQSAPAGIALKVPLQFPVAGLASIGVYDEQGKLIRSLSYAKPVPAGAQTFEWDGTTDLGLPAGPGTYHVRGITFPEAPKINYVMKVGQSGEPPYLTDDLNSGWGACHGPATAICANSKNLLAIFRCTESPRETGIQLMDFEGKIVRRFSGFFPGDGVAEWAALCPGDAR